MIKKYLGGPVIAICLLLASAQIVHGAEGRLIGLGGADIVFVWESKAAHDEGLSLINAGVHQSNPALLMELLACLVPSGTRAITTDMGFATHDIMVIEGESSGCRGNVAMEAFDIS